MTLNSPSRQGVARPDNQERLHRTLGLQTPEVKPCSVTGPIRSHSVLSGLQHVATVLTCGLAAERHVRKWRPPSDGIGMGGDQPRPAASDPVLTIYRVALPQVYGYLLPRCGSAALAEDLTRETFLAAPNASRQGSLTEVSTAWLVGVARHKLVGRPPRCSPPQRCAAERLWLREGSPPARQPAGSWFPRALRRRGSCPAPGSCGDGKERARSMRHFVELTRGHESRVDQR